RTAILGYSETDRVTAIEPVIDVRRWFDDERVLSGKLVVDTLTGASATGAVPSDQPQTFTRPSGNGSYTTSPGETPLDDTFRDTRVALAFGWSQPLSRAFDGRIDLNVSNEYDYLSLGLSAQLGYDFHRNNSRLTFGLGAAQDTISPEGGVPRPSAEAGFRPDRQEPIQSETDFSASRLGAEEDKTTLDALLGFTQVIDRRSLLQLNLSISQSDGYQTDPFKVVSVVDSVSGQPLRQLYENRPDSRIKTAAFVRYKRAFRARDVLDTSYRFLTDDWGLSSHTVDLRYRFALGSSAAYLRPHLRLYQQSAVDFFRYFLVDGDTLPTEVTADYRQGDMTAFTLGLEYGRQYTRRQWGVALEYYRQTGSEPDNAPGQLGQQELAPDVSAVLLRLNYDFGL
ncbi:MAG: DUF3570 domain-containing protein, partial [Oceanococcaceae bacterium]